MLFRRALLKNVCFGTLGNWHILGFDVGFYGILGSTQLIWGVPQGFWRLWEHENTIDVGTETREQTKITGRREHVAVVETGNHNCGLQFISVHKLCPKNFGKEKTNDPICSLQPLYGRPPDYIWLLNSSWNWVTSCFSRIGSLAFKIFQFFRYLTSPNFCSAKNLDG